MKSVFADTCYWVAVTRPGDSLEPLATAAKSELGPVRLVTTDDVLDEFLAALRFGSTLRVKAVKMVRAIRNSPNVKVVPQSRAAFEAALTLYEERPDKEYSLTDCISMNVMEAEGISEVLTNDHHFEQERLVILLR